MQFVFNFDNIRSNLCRRYKFDMQFSSKANLEHMLDWAENSDDILEFLNDMERFGSHDVDFDPNTDFYGFESTTITPKNYITVMEHWRDFFIEHGIDCSDIEEIIDDKLISIGH